MISPELLRRYPLFAGQDYEMLKKMAMLATEEEKDVNKWVFFEGEVAKTMYLILDGAVSLTMNMGESGDKRLEKLAPIKEGELVGWSALIPPHTYNLGAQAVEKTRLVAFDGGAMRKLLDDNPVYGYYFMSNIAGVIGQRLVSKCAQLMSILV